MRLGTLAKSKVRHLVGLLRDLQGEQYRAYEGVKQKREVLSKLRSMHAAAQRELDDMQRDASLRGWPGDAQQREGQRLRGNVAELTDRMREVEEEIAKLNARHDELAKKSRQAGAVAESVMRFVDGDEQLLRDELDWHDPGYNPPPALRRSR